MNGRVDETNPMRGVTQVGRAGRHRMQDAALTFFAQVLRVADLSRHPLHQPGGLVRIELIGNENPGPGFIRRHSLGNVVDEIHFGACVADGRGELLACRHFVIGDQTLRAVTNVFVFLPRATSRLSGDTRLCRFRGRGALQRLDTGLFIRTDQVDALRVQHGRGSVVVAHGGDLRVELRRIPLWGVEPTCGVPQIKVELILKNARQWSGKCGARCYV